MSLECTVRHAVPGRIRFCIPALTTAPEIQNAIVHCVTAHPGIKRVRLNRACASIIVSYDAHRTDLPEQLHSALKRTSIESFETVPPQPPISRTRKVAGRSLLAAGIVGWLLPLIPGTPFVVAAVMILGKDDPVVRYGRQKFGRWHSLIPRRPAKSA